MKLPRKVSEDISRILSRLKTESCSVHVVNRKDERVFATYRVQDNGHLQCFPEDDGTIVYPIGSMTKAFIAIALHLIIDVYRVSGDPEHKKYRRLIGWNQRYVDAINQFSGHRVLESLDGDPTLQQLLVHFKGLPDVNRFILAPNGSPISSNEEFLKLAKNLSAAAERDYPNWLEYSNGNYILIGILIKAISGMSLGQFLKEHIFDRVGMDRTYVDVDEVNRLITLSRAWPQVITRHGMRRSIEDQVFLSDEVEIAALGIYSC